MAYFDSDIYGSVPVVKKFQFGVTLTQSGIPFTVPAAGTAGVVIGTTTGATDLVGLSLDQGSDRLGGAQSTYTTTQGSGAASAESNSPFSNLSKSATRRQAIRSSTLAAWT